MFGQSTFSIKKLILWIGVFTGAALLACGGSNTNRNDTGNTNTVGNTNNTGNTNNAGNNNNNTGNTNSTDNTNLNPGGKEFGAGPCQKGKECRGGWCVPSQVNSYCTQSCEGEGSCPRGYACAIVSAKDQVCVRINPSGANLGEACTAIEQCRSGICIKSGYCTKRCEKSNSCPSGMTCEDAGVLGAKTCVKAGTTSPSICKQDELTKANQCIQGCGSDSACGQQCFLKHLSQACTQCLSALVSCGNQSGCDPATNTNCCAPQRIKCYGQ